ncbi:beta-ketoacyl-[acyl-carrier-protein] synthase family protein [Hymenobacter cavernae]|uniref:Beta-ketoacyl synthase n=1 Tax=Hymenobacter cavernae TaxID=2044852 RepID=A0ABQ1TXF7_9BACT|nr:beta-ketoacyl synthase N-terminal-like domain-containing protein [Hymenobacter cavernae]GGF03905.1 beta-ketoacyl synthase [Hymenobacter cavernae]
MKKVLHAASTCITPLGFTTAATFDAVQTGESGLRPHWFDFSDESFCTATIDEARLAAAFDNLGFPANPYSKLEKMSILAVTGALSQVDTPLTGPDTLLVYCSTKGNIGHLAGGTSAVVPPTLYLSQLARTVAQACGFANEPVVVSNACISSLQGVLIAKRLLSAGRYRHAVVVGADEVSKFTLAGFHAFNALSRQPCRPFDATREGINLGDAAVAMVLTTVPGVGSGDVEVVTGFSTNDAHHISAPSRTGEGLYQAVTKVLRQMGEGTVDFIGAHGTATRYNDEMEAQAFHRAGLHDVPLHSLKGYFGHTLGAAGILEAALGIESMRRNELIASKGYQTCGTSLPVRPIARRTRAELRHFLKTSSGFGGCNAAVLFAKAA